MDSSESANYLVFRDCIAAEVVQRTTQPAKATTSKPKSRRTRQRHVKKPGSRASAPVQEAEIPDADVSLADELSDFVDYVASETFPCLPPQLQSLSHHTWADSPSLQEAYSVPIPPDHVLEILPTLPPEIVESLDSYGSGSLTSAHSIVAVALSMYIAQLSAAPPAPRSTLADAEGCELCGRDWIPLTYHHLIPRLVHDRAVRRGWHRADELDRVAWLCGACHGFVHRFASHEDLAQYYHTIDLLLENDEVVAFARWASNLRWKGGRSTRGIRGAGVLVGQS